jgi:hypothetical protein
MPGPSPPFQLPPEGNWQGLLATLVDIGNFLIPDAWHTVGATGEPVFQNSWVSAAGISFHDPQFRRINRWYGMIRGAVKDGTNNSVAFTLPWAPTKDLMYITQGFAAADTFTRVRVKSNGDVVVNQAATPTAEAHIGPILIPLD